MKRTKPTRPAASAWALFVTVAPLLTACSAIQQLLEEAPEPVTLRVLSYNVRHGEGLDRRLDLERVAAVIREARPDIVALQEIDRNTDRTDRVDQAARLGELTGLEHVFGAFMEYQGGEYGMALLSRWPVVATTNHPLPPGAEPRSTLAARIRLPGVAGEVIVSGIHLYRTEAERLRQARRLVDIFEHEQAPVILAGDFNSPPGDPIMDLVGQHWTLPKRASPSLTFPANQPDREIDFIGYRPADRCRVLEYRVLSEPVASDHRPVLMVLSLR